MKNLENTLLIGSSGFVGKNLKKFLNSNNVNFYEIYGKEDVDIESEGKLDSFIKKNNTINSIINCAAFVGGVSYGYQFEKDLIYKNSKLALNIYEAAHRNKVQLVVNPISNCIYPSNIEVYKEKNMFEGLPHESVYFYAQSKRFTIFLSEAYFKQHGICSNNIILSNMYGPDDHFEEERSHAVGAIIRKIVEAKRSNIKSVEIWGSGNQEREWMYIEDGVNAIVKSFNITAGYNTFNIGENSTFSIKFISEKIKKISKWDGELIYNPNKPEGVLKKSVDGTYGNSLIKWKPKTDIETGLKNTINWYMENK
jgi:GDP-L-fucose synthase